MGLADQSDRYRDTHRIGNLWFGWLRTVDDRSKYVLVEAFPDQRAGAENLRPVHGPRLCGRMQCTW